MAIEPVETEAVMTDTAAGMAALFQQLQKLFKTLPDQANGLISGSSKLVVLGPEQQIIDREPSVQKALLFARRLSPEQAAQLEVGDARIALVRKGGRIQYPLDLGEVAAAVRQISSADQIVKYLDSDTRLTAAKLRALGYELNVEIPSKLRTRADIQFHLAQVVATHRTRAADATEAG
jgi:hypothetical protein